jgi:hypothetical protein
MVALQRVGRTAEALHAYERNRRWLNRPGFRGDFRS